MRRQIGVVAVLILMAGCADRREPSFGFTELAFPGARATVAAGINDAGHIVGWYKQGDVTYGFLYADGNYTSVQYPDAVLTQLVGINSAGDVSGGYRRAGETQTFQGQPIAYHGFVRTRAGEFLEAGHPSHKYSMAQRILADGSIVGCYHDDDFTSMRGTRIPRRALTATGVNERAITVLDTPSSMNNGGSPDGSRVVGYVMSTGQAYVFENGALKPFTAPNAKSTEAWDINGSGVIVGVAQDSRSISQGFVLENGRFTTISYPGAKSTIAFGINARGDIVGGFEGADGQRRAYVATRK
jgi:probable HAF family extracellular repeat protein